MRTLAFTAILLAAGLSHAKPRQGGGSEPRASQSSSSTAATSAGSLGLGLILGDPTAVGLRYWFTQEMAGQLWLGGTPYYRGVVLIGDAVWATRDIIPVNAPMRFDFWLGGGVALGSYPEGVTYRCYNDPWRTCHDYDADGGVYLAGRLPLGLSLVLRRVPLEFFLELAPTLVLAPFVGFGLDGGIGGRYYF